jgi:Toastrack DUF4097
LLFLILGFGTVVEGLWTVRDRVDIGAAGCRLLRGRFEGPSFSFEEASSLQVPSPLRVEITNAFGRVSVVQGVPGRARVGLHKVVFLRKQEEARQFAERILLQAALDGSTLRVGTNRPALERSDSATGFETHFELQLPPGTSVRVENDHGAVDVADVGDADVSTSFESIRVERVAGDATVASRHGDVQVSGVAGSLSLSSRFGDVKLADLTGPARLEVQRGEVEADRTGHLSLELQHGSASLTGIGGDLELRGEHAGARVQGVEGRATLATSYASLELRNARGDARVTVDHGGLEASRLDGGLEARVSFGDVDLESLAGPAQIEVDHGGLRGTGLAGGGKLRVSGDDVSLEGFRGAFEVEARRGSVELAPAEPLTGELRVTTLNGGIRLEVPDGSAFQLSATSNRGDVEADVPGLSVRERGPSHVEATLGSGGPRVTLSANHGDVVLAPSARATER